MKMPWQTLRSLFILTASLWFTTQSLSASVASDEATVLFEKVLQTEEAHYELNLKIESNLEKAPGAFAKWKKVRETGTITLTQTMLDLEGLTLNGLSVILCHELGHFLGGEPYVKVKGGGSTIFSFSNPFKFMSVEGQADYYATNVCLPKILEREFPNTTAQWRYFEASRWIEEVAEVYSHINGHFFGIEEDWSMDGHDDSIVQKMNLTPGSYPSLQCRVDTMKAGLLGLLQEDDVQRPNCWFVE